MRHDAPHDPARRERKARRFARIAGQVQGIERMVREDRTCIDVLTQTAAARAALARAEAEVLRDHASGCVADAIRAGDADATRRKLDEIVDLFARARRRDHHDRPGHRPSQDPGPPAPSCGAWPPPSTSAPRA